MVWPGPVLPALVSVIAMLRVRGEGWPPCYCATSSEPHPNLHHHHQNLYHHHHPHHHLITIVIAIFTTITNLIFVRGIAKMMLCCIHAPSFRACYRDNLKITIMFSNCFQWADLNLFNTMGHQDQQEQRKRFIGCQIGNSQKFKGPPEQEYMKLCRKGLVGLRWQWLRWGRIGLGWAAD